ncbi:MAG: glycoside hydrolase family 71/99-like protein [Lentisphaerales bacterium]|nr:glycoside hydrolase family 71/99-like protein [Lentisphaerales bacterium]
MHILFKYFFYSSLLILTALPAQKKKLYHAQVWATATPYAGEYNPAIDTKTLDNKVMCGYQGWFNAEGDGANSGWRHYGGRKFGPGSCTFEYWPDMSEMTDTEKFPTPFKYADGSTAHLFSSYNQQTVERHFKWMQDYGIDGVFLQRFGVSIKRAEGLKMRNQVTRNVQSGANKYGRAWANMYDLSGLKKGEIKSILMEDWKLLVDKMKILEDKSYLHHKGKPVISIWGIGFGDDRDYTLEECEELIDFLKNDPKYGGLTIKIGIPAYWRELERDSTKNPKLHEIISKADIISPWAVGRYGSGKNGLKNTGKYVNTIAKADKQWTQEKSIDYIPVIFPGFSWKNLKKYRGEDAKFDHIPRIGGEFLWFQAKGHITNGCNMLYVAMFDEIDEGTAIFKCSSNPPVGKSDFLTYKGLPSDHYLWLTGEISKMLRVGTPIEMPSKK